VETLEMRMSFNSFPDKAGREGEGSFENLWAIYLRRHTLHYISKNLIKIATP